VSFTGELGALAPEGGALIARPKGAGKGRKAPARQRAARIAILAIVLGYLLLPLLAMLEFSTRGNVDPVTKQATRSLQSYAAILSYPNLVDGIVTSLEIAVLTVFGMLLLLVPTMVWTVVRVPRMRRVVEFLCLLPLAIPAIVIVVGIAPVYRFMGQHLGAVGASPLTLAFIDIILVLPYAYRAIDSSLRSIDTATLADAARSLGAGWPRAILQVIVPNIRGGILSASVLAIALVLGEFTIANLAQFHTFPIFLQYVNETQAYPAAAVTLMSFALTWGAMLGLLFIGRGRGARPTLLTGGR